MKFIFNLKIIILTVTVCGFSFKTRAQQLASQKPLSAFYSEKVKARLAVKKENNTHLSPSQVQRNLPSVRPLPTQATESKLKSPQVARNAAIPDNEKIKRLPSKSALTVKQIAARRPAAQKPLLH
jgi:hypothetical protein